MNDLALYDRHAQDWWNEDSRFAASLHALNRVRRQELSAQCAEFRGLAVDLGCGGGLMAEPLAGGGARVLGVDISQASLRVAREHGGEVAGLAYLRATATRVPLASACADLVLMADVLEHVEQWREVVCEAARLAKPGAVIYANTINRTWRARILAIAVVETLRLVPPGTHSHAMLIRPQELASAAQDCGCTVERISGYRLRLGRTLMSWRVQLEASDQGRWGCYSMWLRKR